MKKVLLLFIALILCAAPAALAEKLPGFSRKIAGRYQ